MLPAEGEVLLRQEATVDTIGILSALHIAELGPLPELGRGNVIRHVVHIVRTPSRADLYFWDAILERPGGVGVPCFEIPVDEQVGGTLLGGHLPCGRR